MNKTICAAILLAGTSLNVAACNDAAEENVATDTGTAAIDGIEVTNARLMLPPVAGNPAAIYFDVANTGDRNIAFRSAEVEKAGRAEVHDMMEYDFEMVMGEAPPIMVGSSGSVAFEPGGKHVMAFELDEDFVEGDTTEVTLIAAGNKRHTFEATAQAAGDDR